jgi:phosphatidate cytidylyltransferase
LAVLKRRIATSVLLVPFVVLLIWLGHPSFSFLVAAVTLTGTLEFYRMSASLGGRRLLPCVGLTWALAVALSPHYEDVAVLSVVMAVAMVASLVGMLCLLPRQRAFYDWAWVVAGVLYVGWMLSYWIRLGMLANGREWVCLAVLTTFAYDTGAFFSGGAWGRHRLAPAISPEKTWEGAAGGLLSAVVVATAVSRIPVFLASIGAEYWQVAILACLVGLSAQIGDLVESLLKRSTGVKESGKLLPGHGGVLDRVDSLIFVGVVVYYYVLWVIG